MIFPTNLYTLVAFWKLSAPSWYGWDVNVRFDQNQEGFHFLGKFSLCDKPYAAQPWGPSHELEKKFPTCSLDIEGVPRLWRLFPCQSFDASWSCMFSTIIPLDLSFFCSSCVPYTQFWKMSGIYFNWFVMVTAALPLVWGRSEWLCSKCGSLRDWGLLSLHPLQSPFEKSTIFCGT